MSYPHAYSAFDIVIWKANQFLIDKAMWMAKKKKKPNATGVYKKKH